MILGASGCIGDDGAAADPDAIRCTAPDGVNTAPSTVADVVALVDALPSPVTMPCFLDALARPLEMHATRSIFSAQPAVGARSPRIFLFYEGLRMSIVPAGVGSRLLEIGEVRDDRRSLKAEIEFPVAAPLTPQAPFDRIMFTPTATTCSFCHAGEEPAPDVTFTTAFTSVALRPLPTETVTVDYLAAQRASCDPGAEPDRCAMLRSLFAKGKPLEQPFPTDLTTFY